MLIAGPDFRYNNYNTLSQNYFPANPGLVQFVDYANGGVDYHGYALAGTSPFKNAGTDGKDLGADIDSIAKASIYKCDAPTGMINNFSASASVNRILTAVLNVDFNASGV